ncbi:cupredoxin domain-containing protein [Pseudogemmobacter sp. W21_MBD1_M6]|uniref:cupredoxin domain-containing protein n=1 Tax=Pseudogemmobacter sp. W21_MBD1_M6 TaxID=3240271 RepID=UPI003F9899C3
MKQLLLSTALVLSANAASAAGSHSGGHMDMMSIGGEGAQKAVTKTVDIIMKETDDGKYVFEPSDLTFKAGETVRFNIKNIGEQVHEFVMDEFEKNVEHKAMMEKFPEMEHDDPNAIRLEPGMQGEIVWTFANTGSFEFACLIPGHYEAGMHGPLSVSE